MARRRLNKKVALIGSTVFLLLAMAAVGVILRLNRNPGPLIADGDAALAARDYESARRNYARAYGLTHSTEGKIELLFKLAGVYKETNQWDRVLACWRDIVVSEPQNVKVRLGQLKYAYVLADSVGNAGRGTSDCWNEVLSQAKETIKIVQGAGLLGEEKAKWDSSLGAVADRRWAAGARILGPHLRFITGRAALELAAMGAVTSPVELLKEAEADLQESLQLDPNNAQVYHCLAQVLIERGETAASRGNLDQKDAAEKQADDILAQGARAAANTPESHIHILARKLTLAQRGGITATREQMKALEPQYEVLTQKFTSSPQAFAALAQFYSFYATYLDAQAAVGKLEQAIRAAEQARALDNSVEYLIFAASYNYRKFSIGSDASALQKAVELAQAALELPEAQDTPGPTQYAKRINRFSLCKLLAKCCVERVLALPKSDPGREKSLALAEQAVHEIEQIQGSGQNSEVLMWRGMLDLARGQTGKAVRNLHAAYEQIKAANAPEDQDPFLSYTLARVFEDTSEAGAVMEFLGTALSSGIIQTRPTAILDYGDILLRVGSYDAVVSAVSSFEERFGPSRRSQVLRTRALVASGHVTEAEKGIAQLDPDDPNVVSLKVDLVRAKAGQLLAALREKEPPQDSTAALPAAAANREDRSDEAVRALKTELRDNRRQEADLVERLLPIDPNAVEEPYVIRLCQSLAEQGDAGVAKTVTAAFLKSAPDSVAALFYQRLLAEPDPLNCPESRRKELQEQAIRAIADPLRRSLELGSFYEENQQGDKAISEWRSVLDATASQGAPGVPAYLKARQLNPRHVAAGRLFDLARQREKWDLAQEIVALAQRDDLDDCSGHLFAARLAYARGERDNALSHLDECLRQRPIFSYGYMLRSDVKTQLGREEDSVADVRKAAALNPLDPLVARAMANALYVRNNKLGNSLSAQQKLETKQALERAVHLNPRDPNLLAVYADFLSDSEPLTALALRQTIQTHAPSLSNAVMLGKLATRIALKEAEETRKRAFFAMAEAAFEQAKKMEPTNQFMLDSYAEYFRAREQNEKARQLLVESNDSQLLWRHHFRVGGFSEAKKLLEKMYAENRNRADALKGLVLVAEATGDKESAQKYSEELLSLEDNVVNRLAQLRAYLNVGLIQEAEQKLQSFKAKYPEEPRALLMEALVAKRQGQLQQALGLVDQHLEGNPGNAAAWRLRGEIAFLMGDHDRAILDFRKSRAIEDDPATTVDLAKAYLWTGRNDEAINDLRGVLDRPEPPLEARMILEATYIRLGRTEALKQLYAATLTEFPDSVLWLNRAGAFAIEQKQYDKAEELYAKAYQLERQSAADVRVGDAIRDLQYAAALDGYLRALIAAAGEPGTGGTWHPEKLDAVFQEGGKYVDTVYAAIAFYRMAEAKKKLGDADAMRDYCRKAVDKAWGNEQLAVEVLLRVYLMLGGEEVSKYCQQRLAQAPNSLAANFTMFNLAKIQNRLDEAERYVDKCIQLAGPDTERGTDYVIKKAQLLTAAYKNTSDKTYLQRAIEVYESLRVKMPKNSSVLNNLAYMLAQNDEKLTEALEYAKTAVEQSPDEANYRDTYAYVLYKNGKHTEAAVSLAAAIQQYETAGAAPADVYEHLGMVNEALGERSKAQTAYRRALEVGGDTMSSGAKERINLAIERLMQ